MPQGVLEESISLLFGHPDPSTLNTPAFQAAVSRVLASPDGVVGLEYGEEQGNPALIRFLVEKVNREQGLSLTRDQVMITAGSTGALDMIARLHTQPGDVVIVEAPSYADSLHTLKDHGVELHGVPMDSDGVIVSEFEALLRRLADVGKSPRMFYSIPNFHNPTGITLTESRRVEIIRLAREYGFFIVEDDVYRDLGFEPNVPASFWALAREQGIEVIHIGSFSKTLAPGLRLGFLIASAETISGFVNCGVMQMGGGSSPYSAQIAAEFCTHGDWEPHVTRLRDVYRARRDVIVSALASAMPDGISWTYPNGGFFIWLTLPEGLIARQIKAEALQRGVIVTAGEGFFIDPADGARHIRLAFSFAPPDDIRRAVQILSDVIRNRLA